LSRINVLEHSRVDLHVFKFIFFLPTFAKSTNLSLFPYLLAFFIKIHHFWNCFSYFEFKFASLPLTIIFEWCCFWLPATFTAVVAFFTSKLFERFALLSALSTLLLHFISFEWESFLFSMFNFQKYGYFVCYCSNLV